MSFRNNVFIFFAGLICFVILITQHSNVYASQAVFDEIEKVVSPLEEMQIDEPIQQDLSAPFSTDVEEKPAADNEQNKENGETIQKNIPVEKQNISAKKTSTNPKPKDLSIKTLQTKDNNSTAAVSDEEPIPETKSELHYITFSGVLKKCSSYFSRLPFDDLKQNCTMVAKKISKNTNFLKQPLSKICTQIQSLMNYYTDGVNELKETFIQNIASNQFAESLFFKQAQDTEDKPIVYTRDFVPYYFLYFDPIKNLLEKIVFTDKITSPKELLPYIYIIKNSWMKIDAPKNAVTPQGTTDIRVLINAPSPKIEVVGKSLFAKLVIDIRNNTLYKYDEDGFPLKAYLVATGARGSRTMPGLRMVTYKEQFPYKWAPINSKRLFDPYSYGPYILFLNVVNPKTGRQYVADQLLHGNGNERSIGRKVSHGCVRTNNNVMRHELSKEVKRGDYILLINPD